MQRNGCRSVLSLPIQGANETHAFRFVVDTFGPSEVEVRIFEAGADPEGDLVFPLKSGEKVAVWVRPHQPARGPFPRKPSETERLD